MTRSRIKSAPAIALAAAIVLPFLLVLGAPTGTGQDRAAAKPAVTGQDWTAESHDRTNFPLIGKHRTLGCRECHLNLVFEGTPADCEVCHWQRRQDDRFSLRLGTRCSDCHTPQSFKKVDPALWSHEVNAGYRLEGVHRTLDCEDCHGSGGFTARSPECVSCHLADYNGTTDPNHRSAGFPLDCEQCHGTAATGWSGAEFDHPFPIQSGRHSGAACSECHQTSDYRVFNCLGCHGQQETNSNHNGVTGYSYSSPACYACHPQGQAAPSTRSPRL
jgi:hypothetical protein